MTRFQRKHRKDLWFHRYSELMDSDKEGLKQLWFISDEELAYIENNLNEVKLNMFRKPEHLSFAAKRRIVCKVNELLDTSYSKSKIQSSLLSQAEAMQKTIFDFGNSLLNYEVNSPLLHYQFKVLKLVPLEIEILRCADEKRIANFNFCFYNYSHPGSYIEDLVKEFQWQKAFKAPELVFTELFELAHIFGIQKEYNQLISSNNGLEKTFYGFGAELYVGLYNSTFNELVVESLNKGEISNDKIKELKRYTELLRKNGWTMKSDLWQSLVFYSKFGKGRTAAKLAKPIIEKLRDIKQFGEGFYVFSEFHKEWRFSPSKQTLIQIEEALRNEINYWKYE